MKNQDEALVKSINRLTAAANEVERLDIRFKLEQLRRPALFAVDAEHRTSELVDAVPWSVIEGVLK